MPLRLAHLLLASLLLFTQLASSVMQLCLEEDGSVSVELAGIDCNESSPAVDTCEFTSMEAASAKAHACDVVHENDCPCLDFGLGLALSVNKDWSSTALDLPSVLPLELPLPCLIFEEGTPANLVPSNGQLSLAWLEHADVLARHHAAHAVVMNC